MSGAMLQRLKFADRFAELLAFFQISDGTAKCFFGRADHLSRNDGAADVEHTFEDVPTRIDFAEHILSADAHVLKCDSRSVVRVHRRRALCPNSERGQIDEKQRETVGVAGFARGSRDYDQKIRNVAIEHESLGAVELEAIAGASRGH